MRNVVFRCIYLFVIGLFFCLCYGVSSAGDAKSTEQDSNILPYKNTNLTFEERARDLVSRMTLEEKISQMQNDAPAIERLGVQKYEWWSECLHEGYGSIALEKFGRNILGKIS